MLSGQPEVCAKGPTNGRPGYLPTPGAKEQPWKTPPWKTDTLAPGRPADETVAPTCFGIFLGCPESQVHRQGGQISGSQRLGKVNSVVQLGSLGVIIDMYVILV